MRRAPHPDSPTEIRQAFQKGNTDLDGVGDDIDALDVRVTVIEAWPASAITEVQITNWDTAYGWGDHGAAGYLKADGSIDLTGNLSVDIGITIDGRDISVDGTTLDALSADFGKVKVDTDATADFLGAAYNDGSLRTGTGISYADGGNFITLTTNDSEIDHGALAGIIDDDHTLYSLADGTRAFSGVVVGVSPTDGSHLATKEYVDMAIAVIQPLFLLDAAHNDIASCKNTQVFNSGLSVEDVTTVSVVDDQALQAWASADAESTTRDIPAGVFELNLHVAKTAGQEDLQIYFKVFEVDSGFAETLIMTSETSAEITGEIHIAIHATLGAPHEITSGSWILIRVYATITGAGNPPTAVLYYQGDTSSRFALPTLAVSIDHGSLLGLTDDDHSQYHTDARAATWLAANHETTYNHGNYDTAYGWGNHATPLYRKYDAYEQTNNQGGAIVIGQAVYNDGNGTVKLAKADASSTIEVLGLAVPVTTAHTVAGLIATDGVLTATTGQWDTVAGTSGGLSAGTVYYLSKDTAGYITATAPTTAGEYVVRIGKALSTLDLEISISQPILL